jgi:hypothetical protein
MGGGYEGAEAIRRGLMKFWGEEALFGEKDCIFCLVFFWFGSLGGLLQGCTRLLGVLGSGARNPHGILELGSQIGSVPSWQGGKIQFWAEFGQSSSEDNEDWRISIRQRYVF